MELNLKRSCVLFHEYQQDKQNYNTYHVHEYDPYVQADNKLIVDTEWFDSLTDLIKNRISKLDIELGKVKVPLWVRFRCRLISF